MAIAVLGEGDSLRARLVAALTGGVVTSLVGCPFDVLKTRLMNQGAVRARYDGTWSCLCATVRTEGAFALWKGLLPVYCRQAPFNMLCAAIARTRHAQGPRPSLSKVLGRANQSINHMD